MHRLDFNIISMWFLSLDFRDRNQISFHSLFFSIEIENLGVWMMFRDDANVDTDTAEVNIGANHQRGITCNMNEIYIYLSLIESSTARPK